MDDSTNEITTEQNLNIVHEDIYVLTQYNAELLNTMNRLESNNRILLNELEEINKKAGWIKFFTFVCALPGILGFIISILAIFAGINIFGMFQRLINSMLFIL